MSDLGCRMSNLGCRMSNLGCQMSDVKSGMSDVGCRMSDVESRMAAISFRRYMRHCFEQTRLKVTFVSLNCTVVVLKPLCSLPMLLALGPPQTESPDLTPSAEI